MSDFMCWLYDHYIHPYLQSQPMDDGDTFRRSLLDSGVTPAQRADVEAVLCLPELPFRAAHRGRAGGAFVTGWGGPPAPVCPGAPPPPAQRRGRR